MKQTPAYLNDMRNIRDDGRLKNGARPADWYVAAQRPGSDR